MTAGQAARSALELTHLGEEYLTRAAALTARAEAMIHTDLLRQTPPEAPPGPEAHLCLPEPYSALYLWWTAAGLYFAAGDYTRYEAARSMALAQLSSAAAWIVRTGGKQLCQEGAK